MSLTVHKVVQLSEERARRLEQLASASGTTEDALIEKALDIYFGLSETDSAEEERQAWSKLGLRALERVWENDADAVYDNWKELYGVSDG
jgi:predicted transcriptional regulator